jgi:tRNA threonylcarbamoyladenosine biosynthesis protein TsaE
MDSSSPAELFTQLRKGLLSTSVEATEAVGAGLAAALPEDAALALSGDLGSGKTTLVRGLARALKIKETVTSPTFTIYALYEGERQLLHMDAYRLERESDLDSLMLDDFLKSPFLAAVEWAEKIPGFFTDLPTWHLLLEGKAEGQTLIRLTQTPESS